MYVIPSKLCKERDWWPSVKHLEGKKMKVLKEGTSPRGTKIIQFLDTKGRIRTWSVLNLDAVRSIQLENK